MFKPKGGRLVNDMLATTKLDAVLKVFAEDMYLVSGVKLEGISPHKVLSTLNLNKIEIAMFKDSFGDTTEIDLQNIIDKLVEDGYVKPTKTGDSYKISFIGSMFYENGGYNRSANRIITLEVLQSLGTWAISIGTILAAVSTSGLFYFEYQNHSYFDSYPFYILAIVIILATTIAVGILIMGMKGYKRRQSINL